MQIGLINKLGTDVKDIEYSMCCDREMAEAILNCVGNLMLDAADHRQIDAIVELAQIYRRIQKVLNDDE